MDTQLRKIIVEREARQQADAKRFTELDKDLCQLCHAYGNDKRMLWLACFYAVHEFVPEAIDLSGVENEALKKRGYFLCICKSCRGRLLTMLQTWRNECVALRSLPKNHDGYIEDEDSERNIPMRVAGATVMMTREEYDAYCEKKKSSEQPPDDQSLRK